MTKTKKKAEPKQEDDHGRSQAIAQLESIREMVAALEAAGDNDEKREEAETTIHEDPLSVQVRSDWYEPGADVPKPSEFEILLCTGGPAVRIMGDLNEYGEPTRAYLQYQDWGTPWQDFIIPGTMDTILTYCRQFYFGE